MHKIPTYLENKFEWMIGWIDTIEELMGFSVWLPRVDIPIFNEKMIGIHSLWSQTLRIQWDFNQSIIAIRQPLKLLNTYIFCSIHLRTHRYMTLIDSKLFQYSMRRGNVIFSRAKKIGNTKNSIDEYACNANCQQLFRNIWRFVLSLSL